MRWCRVFLDATEPEPDVPAGSSAGADAHSSTDSADPQARDQPRPAPGGAALDRARTLALA